MHFTHAVVCVIFAVTILTHLAKLIQNNDKPVSIYGAVCLKKINDNISLSISLQYMHDVRMAACTEVF
jgi:hypothetical protein